MVSAPIGDKCGFAHADTVFLGLNPSLRRPKCGTLGNQLGGQRERLIFVWRAPEGLFPDRRSNFHGGHTGRDQRRFNRPICVPKIEHGTCALASSSHRVRTYEFHKGNRLGELRENFSCGINQFREIEDRFLFAVAYHLESRYYARVNNSSSRCVIYYECTVKSWVNPENEAGRATYRWYDGSRNCHW